MVSSNERKFLPSQARWFLNPVLVVLALFLASGSSAFAACHTVTSSGSGSNTGADWNNAYAGIPSSLVRGDIYYLADGTYPAFTFNTAASGTTTVEIRKAQSYDNCTSTGWNTSTMGSAQAVFHRVFNVSAPYLILNGNGKQTAQGCGGAPGPTIAGAPPTPSDCGIKIDDTSCTSNCIGVVSVSSGPFTFEYVEFLGNSNHSANEDNFVFAGGSSPSTYKHIYGHNTGAVYFQYGCNQRTVEYSYFWGTEIQGATADGTHGQYSYCGNTDSNGVEANNVYRDITGTAVWTFAYPDNTHTGWVFYNNVIFNSTSYTGGSLTLGWLSDGLIACINFTFAQNTIINAGDSSGINNENSGSYIVENNLWYGITHGSISFNVGSGGSYTQNHNSFIASGSSCPSGTGNVCDESGANPFVSWTTNNFNLASDNNDENNRLALGSPFTVDVNGTAFTTDRGAYQYAGAGVGTGPNPPSGLTATVQ
jgi:hypothetical protein